VFKPAELAHDRGERGGDDGLVEGRKQQTSHQTAEDKQYLSVRQWHRDGV
jgi:hypothetical protein